jgi:hypothetical protein
MKLLQLPSGKKFRELLSNTGGEWVLLTQVKFYPDDTGTTRSMAHATLGSTIANNYTGDSDMRIATGCSTKNLGHMMFISSNAEVTPVD